MDKLLLTHYYYPGTDPWKNIMNQPEQEAFRVAAELAAAHPETTSFYRFADFKITIPCEKEQMSMCGKRLSGSEGNQSCNTLIHSCLRKVII